MTAIVKNGHKSFYPSNEIKLINSLSLDSKGLPSKGSAFTYRAATKFSVLDETQNIYIILENPSHDLDIYLTHATFTQPHENELIISQSIASSTNYGVKPESIFARLRPGEYYLDIRANNIGYINGEQFDKNDISFDLTIDSQIFDSELAVLPNDTLLNQQWHLFNGGLLSLVDHPEFETEVNFNENIDGILPNADIVAPEGWKIQNSAQDVIIAVVDDGVDIDHPDLQNNIWINKKELEGEMNNDDDNNDYADDIYGWNFATNTPNPRPYDPSFAHGTHVAGIIGAEGNNDIGVTGVAWDAQLMALNVADPETGFFTGAEEALRYAADNGADIVNMSFGFNLKINPAEIIIFAEPDGSATDDAPPHYKEILNTLHSEFDKLKQEDVLAVIAAGNEGEINTLISEKWQQIGSLDDSISPYNFMAMFFDNAMNISASDGMMNLSPYTNTGLTVDLAAPGGNTTSGTALGILSTYPMGSADISERGFSILEAGHGAVDYGYMQGTSMAAPVVSGAAALVKANNPSLSASEIRDILMFSADKNPKLKFLAGENGLQLNLQKALHSAQDWKGPRSLFTIARGTSENDTLISGPEATWLRGRKGNDVLTGNHGDDRFYGNHGDDVITPGKGFDIIKGGRGQDTFTYINPEESPIARPDRVFMKSEDRFDLSSIDGDHSTPGKQGLVLIDTPTFNGNGGELLARRNGIFADLDGDATADFGILFGKTLSFDLNSDHFIL